MFLIYICVCVLVSVVFACTHVSVDRRIRMSVMDISLIWGI